jgi:hypothetical protein
MQFNNWKWHIKEKLRRDSQIHNKIHTGSRMTKAKDNVRLW